MVFSDLDLTSAPNNSWAPIGTLIPLTNSTDYPPLSVTVWDYNHNPPLSSVNIYPRYATLVYTSNTGDANTYSASISAFTPASTATDIFAISGSPTKTVKVKRIQVSGTAGTAGTFTFTVLKRSTSNTGGTSTVLNAVPDDSNTSAATASVRAYTGNPTRGTLIGSLRSQAGYIPTAAGTSNVTPTIFEFPNGVPLRGPNETLTLNLNGSSISSGALAVDIVWSES